MKRNIGDIDAIVRIMLGFVLAYCYYVTDLPTVWQTLGLILSGLLMLTAVHGSCTLYRILKINTCKGHSCGACAKKTTEEEIETTCHSEGEGHTCDNC